MIRNLSGCESSWYMRLDPPTTAGLFSRKETVCGTTYKIYVQYCFAMGHAVAQLVEALRYK